jgi:hypothetical protein
MVAKDHPESSIRAKLDALTRSGSRANLELFEGRNGSYRGNIAVHALDLKAVTRCLAVINCAGEIHMSRSFANSTPI